MKQPDDAPAVAAPAGPEPAAPAERGEKVAVFAGRIALYQRPGAETVDSPTAKSVARLITQALELNGFAASVDLTFTDR